MNKIPKLFDYACGAEYEDSVISQEVIDASLAEPNTGAVRATCLDGVWVLAEGTGRKGVSVYVELWTVDS